MNQPEAKTMQLFDSKSIQGEQAYVSFVVDTRLPVIATDEHLRASSSSDRGQAHALNDCENPNMQVSPCHALPC